MEGITSTQSFGSGNVDCGNVINSYNKSITVNKTDDEDNQIKQWLSLLEPRYGHQRVQADRVDGVGGWLLELKEFWEWSGSQGVAKQRVLFCYGHPGVGKTHISSLVIDWLCDQVHTRDIAVSGLYCDYLAQEQQSAVSMLGAILKQLLERDGIPEPLRQVFRKEKRGFGGRALQRLGLVEILKRAIASLPEVFICIDGLDECLLKNRQELLESLQDIVLASPTTRLFLSGRPHIRDEVKRYFPESITITVIPTTRDIERYLEMRLDKDPTPSAMDNNLKIEIMRVVPRKMSKIFLLVSLNIDTVLEEVTIHQRKKKLDEMIQGNGLRSAYSATLERIKAQGGSKSRLGMEVLMWLSHSEEPLSVNMLCHALAVEIGSTDQNAMNIPSIETLLGCSQGLVIVEASSYTVRLVHYTLKEYLSNNADLFHRPQSIIAEICLTYLNFHCIRNLPHSLDWSRSATPFLRYASYFWGTHARRDITERVNTLALKLLDGFDKHISSWILLSRHDDNQDWKLGPGHSTRFTGLHGIAYLGIVEIAISLLETKEWDLNATDIGGNTALLWAATKGNGAMVKMLLEQEDVIPNIADKGGRTPLLWAARKGYGDIVKMLLEREDIAPNTVDDGGRGPLSWVAGAGHWFVVKMLLKREDITPDAPDSQGRTPLLHAARNRHPITTGMLLGRADVNPNTPDKGGLTPLDWIYRNGYSRDSEIAKALSKRKELNSATTDRG